MSSDTCPCPSLVPLLSTLTTGNSLYWRTHLNSLPCVYGSIGPMMQSSHSWVDTSFLSLLLYMQEGCLPAGQHCSARSHNVAVTIGSKRVNLLLNLAAWSWRDWVWFCNGNSCHFDSRGFDLLKWIAGCPALFREHSSKAVASYFFWTFCLR